MQTVTVSALTKYLQAKFTRDMHLQHIKLRGQLSNVKFHNKGHLYFTLKDEYARISGVMFSQTLNQIDMKRELITDGMEVELEGSVRVYEGSGTYQVYANKITPSGTGVLQKEFEKLFVKYQELGYFNLDHKRVIPKRIHKLAIITASDGAAIEDIKKSIASHIPHVKVTLFSTLVQGDQAPKHIANAVKKADNGNYDTLIVGRGGGSLEDLWAFNSAEVVEAVFQSKTPIISAVGHEVDTMLSDYVADFRAPTPTAAIYYFDSTDLILSQIEALCQKVTLQINNTLQFHLQTLQLAKQQLKELAPQYQVERKLNTVKIEKMRLLANSPQNQIDSLFSLLKQTRYEIETLMRQHLEGHLINVSENKNKLELLNPIAQLDRGYAFIYDEIKLVTSINDVQSEFLNIQLRDGEVYVKVVSVNGKS